MQIKSTYKKRPVRFLEIYETCGWKIKLYSISVKSELVDPAVVECAKNQLPGWLGKSAAYGLDTYQVATLILHEGKEGCFAIISWWTDENMLQLFAYRSVNNNYPEFKLYSDRGIVTCVWEMRVLWHERNAWVEQVLMKPGDKNAVNNYLLSQFNGEV